MSELSCWHSYANASHEATMFELEGVSSASKYTARVKGSQTKLETGCVAATFTSESTSSCRKAFGCPLFSVFLVVKTTI